MSLPKNLHQAERWLLTAGEDLRAAETLAASALHAPACFLTQQSGEKALKALWYALDIDPWGHSLQRLLNEFPQRESLTTDTDVDEVVGLLDQFYIPTRYPNGLPDLTPGQVYSASDSARGIAAAKSIMSACRRWLDGCYAVVKRDEQDDPDE
jgi:HEPN domain-containing protein